MGQTSATHRSAGPLHWGGGEPARGNLATARAVQQHFLGKATEAVKLALPRP
jgi:hypothetical protein